MTTHTPWRYAWLWLSIAIFAVVGYMLLTADPSGEASQAKQAASEPVRWWTYVKSTSTLEADNSLHLNFKIDEKKCYAAYSQNAKKVCGRFENGIQPQNVTLNPPIKGDWAWSEAGTFSFSPREAWPVDTALTVDIGKALPADVTIQPQIHIRTLPLRPTLTGTFKFDPDDPRIMAVSGEILFNYPVDAKTIGTYFNYSIKKNPPLQANEGTTKGESATNDESATKGEGMLLGEPVLNVSQNGDSTFTSLSYSIPVLRLPKTEGQLAIAMDPGFSASTGGTPSKGGIFFIKLPAIDSLFTLDSTALTNIVGPDLRSQTALSLNFSMPVKPSAVAQKLTLHLLPAEKQEANTPRASQNAHADNDAEEYADAQSEEEADEELSDDAPSQAQHNFKLWSLEDLTPELLARATPLQLRPMNGDDNPSRDISFIIAPSFDATGKAQGMNELEAGRSVALELPAGASGLLSVGNLPMSTLAREIVALTPSSEALQFLQKGGVLALKGEGIISLYSRNLDTVNYEVSQVRPEMLNVFLATNQDILNENTRNHESERLFRNSNFALSWSNSLSIIHKGTLPLNRADVAAPQFSTLQLRPLLQNNAKGLFFLYVEGLRDDNTKVMNKRFVMLTDLALIHKQDAGRGAGIAYAVGLSDGKPRADVTIQVLGANGLPVFTASTDAAGKVTLPDLRGLRDEKKPVALVGTLGDDLAFLPYAHYADRMNYSRFNVGGSELSSKGLNAFLFSERGMFRPGEVLNFGYIVKQGQWENSTTDGIPLKAVLFNPRGDEVESRMLTLGPDGFGELSFPLPLTAATGPWQLQLMTVSGKKHGETLRSLQVMVEEFQPDTLRLQLHLQPQASAGWLCASDLKTQGGKITADVDLYNLFGAPAASHDMALMYQLTTPFFRFAQYPEYTFHVQQRAAVEETSQGITALSKTDDKGAAHFALDLGEHYKGAFKLNVTAEGMAASGGRSVIKKASLLYAPQTLAVGYQSEAPLDLLPQNSTAPLHLLAVDPSLTPVDAGTLTLTTFEVKRVRSLVRDNGQYRYQVRARNEERGTQSLALPASGLTLNLPTATPGEYVLEGRDSANTLILRVPYMVAGASQAILDEDREAVLRARLDKKDYNSGETIEIALTTPFKGAGLITIERERVLTETWFTAEAGQSIQRITIPAGLEGRNYCNITYFRAQDEPDIFIKPLAMSVLPFTINMSARDMGLSLRMVGTPPTTTGGTHSGAGPKPNATLNAIPGATPDVTADLGTTLAAPPALADKEIIAKPGEDFSVSISAAKPGKALVFAVDEGILQLTAEYTTPDPLHALLGNRALQVNTYQYLDRLMPDYARLRGLLSAFGGGDDDDTAVALGQNPFRRPGEAPMVFWSGSVDVGPEGTLVKIPVPEHFNGRVRVMAVGCSPSAVGMAQAGFTARAEVVIEPDMPLFAGPGDIFEAAITLTDMLPRPKNSPQSNAQNNDTALRSVALRVESDGGCTLLDPLPPPLALQRERRQTVRLRFKVEDKPGGHSIRFIASPLPGEVGLPIGRSMGISIRPLMPRTEEILTGRAVKANKNGQFTAQALFERAVYPHFAELHASISTLPLPQIHAFMRRLDQYPYGCTEQRISQAFPLASIYATPELAPPNSKLGPQDIRQGILETVQMLQQRRADEGFSTWPGAGTGDLFLNAYAADFLTTARESGLSIDAGLTENLKNYLEEVASQSPRNLNDARVKAYTAWVLSRNGVLTGNIWGTLTAWFKHYAPGQFEKDISSVFAAGCWKLMRHDKRAEELIRAYTADLATPYKPGYPFDGLSTRAFYLAVLAGQFPELLHEPQARRALDDVINLASEKYWVTISAAQAARALTAYSRSITGTLSKGDNAMRITALPAAGVTFAPDELPVPHGKSLLALNAATKDAHGLNPLVGRVKGFSFSAGAPFFWQAESLGYGRSLPTKAVSNGLEVSAELRALDGTSVQNITQGDDLVMTINLRAIDNNTESIAVTAILPGCFEPVASEAGQSLGVGTSQGERTNDNPLPYTYAERREDRMLLITTADTTPRVFRFRVKVTGRGEFTMPPVAAEAMYSPEIHAQSLPTRLTVR